MRVVIVIVITIFIIIHIIIFILFRVTVNPFFYRVHQSFIFRL